MIDTNAHMRPHQAEDKTPLKQRLNRIEGQVRGIKQMIEDNRPWKDAIQQSSAVIAAVREVALLVIAQQLQNQASRLEPHQRGGDGESVTDFVETLRTSYRFV